jgi:hypothetical protein
MAKPKIVHDDFVSAVRPESKSDYPVIYLSGYINKSPKEGCIRLYTDPNLNNYVDILESEILHSVQNTKEEDPLGGSKLWVKSNDVASKGGAVAGSFLAGNLFSNYAANMYQPGHPVFKEPTTTVVEPTTTVYRTFNYFCPQSDFAPCAATHHYPCSETCRPTFIPPCGGSLPLLCNQPASDLIKCSINNHVCQVSTDQICPQVGVNRMNVGAPYPSHNQMGCPTSVNHILCRIGDERFFVPFQSVNVCVTKQNETTLFPTFRCASIADGCTITYPTDTTIYQGPYLGGGYGYGRGGFDSFNPYRNG